MADGQVPGKGERKDFFLSCTSADRQWAEWIAWQLEAAGYSVYLPLWDLRPGSNFVLEIHQALSQEQRVLCILSPEYLASPAQQVEWAAVWYRDQTAQQHLVVPVRVRFCEVAGLLGALTPLDLVELDEVQARETLLAGLRDERAKPTQTPRYPGPTPRFPGALPALWMVPFRHNRLFTGREPMLQHLHETLTRAKRVALTQVISGLGGIGKTQVAIEYAYRYFSEYQAVLWMRADSQESILSSFLEIANLLQLPEQKEQETALIVSAVQRWYRSHPDWLLIVDNADELDLVQPFLPEGQGQIVLTSRSQITRGMADETLPLDVMDADEGVLLLLRCAKRVRLNQSLEAISEQELADAKKLVDTLDGLPLALDQAGAYIEATGCSVAAYLALYQQHHTHLLQQRGTLSKDYPQSVATTWSLSFQKVEQRSPVAAELLRFCAFLSPDTIPEEIITAGARYLGPLLQTATDPLVLNEAVAALRTYSLLHRDTTTHTLSIHRLVQAVIRNQMEKQDKRQWAERAVRAVNAAFPEVEHRTWPQCDQLLPHALLCTELIAQEQMNTLEAARLLNQAGYYLYERARYTEAEPLYQRALKICEQQVGPQHPNTAQSLNNLASLYDDQGKYERAESLYQRALAIREQQLGPQHPHTAQSLNNLALLYWNQGKYEQAEPLYVRALAIREQQLGPQHPHTAQSLNNLAVLYRDQGKYEQAEPLLKRTLTIKEQQLGPQHPNTARSLNNLAGLYRVQGKYAQAEPLYQQALSIREQQLGPQHPSTATSLNNLANLYRDQGKYEQAEPLYQRALSIREQQLGPLHPRTATSLNNLAELYSDQGKYEQAEPLYQQALAIREQMLGPLHPDTAISVWCLAALSEQQQQYEKAASLYQRALSIDEHALGPQHPTTQRIRANYAHLLHAMGRDAEAAALDQP